MHILAGSLLLWWNCLVKQSSSWEKGWLITKGAEEWQTCADHTVRPKFVSSSQRMVNVSVAVDSRRQARLKSGLWSGMALATEELALLLSQGRSPGLLISQGA